MNNYTILDIDSKLLGLKTARIDLKTVRIKELNKILTDLKKDKVRLVYLFIEKDDVLSNVAVLNCKGYLVDSKIEFSLSLPSSENNSPLIPYVSQYENNHTTPQLISLALQSGIYSRFNIDSHIPKTAFTNMYTTWIKRSVIKKIADAVYVYKKNNSIMGMITIKFGNKNAIIGLLGVDKSNRRQGIGKSLIRYAVLQAKKHKCQTLEVVTQETNQAAVGLYVSCGFKIIKKQKVFHFWLSS